MPFDATDFIVELPAPVQGLNIANIKRVRDHIAGLPTERFDMEDWAGGLRYGPEELRECGTTACIGGWTNFLFGHYGRSFRFYDWTLAADTLGLGRDLGRELFFSCVDPATSPAQAVRVLDHLMSTGEVDWSKRGPL